MTDEQPIATGPAMPIATPDNPQGLTNEQSATIEQGLWRPTMRRIGVLVRTLVNQTANGDLVVWAPLAALEDALGDLKFDAATPLDAARLCELGVRALRLQADRLERFSRAMKDRQPGDPMPVFEAWKAGDTLAIYDAVEAMYPKGDPRG